MWLFESPAYLLLLTLFLPLIYFRYIYKGRGGTIPAATGIWKGSNFTSRNHFLKFLLFVSTVSFWAGSVCLVLALAGPSYVEREKIYLSRGTDIVFILDESPSMAAMDFPPVNRFESAKDVIRKFVNAREHDPVGLVTFADQAALRIPPTLDYDGFMNELEGLEMMELGSGTAVGLGIAIAALHMEDSTADERIMILITDGENNAGEIEPSTAADIAGKMGIKIYSIGIGTRGEVPIEYTDRETGKIITGQFNSDFDEALLSEIADKTGGHYFYAPSTTALNSIISHIDSLESSEKRVKIKTTAKPGYRRMILLALILISLDLFIRKLLLREVL